MSDEKTQSPQENPFEASPSESEAAPIAQEETVKSDPAEEAPSIDEEAFLAELEDADKDPGDSEGGAFWVIRKILLEILKVAVVLGVIGAVIWLIWSGNSQDERTSVPKKEKKETPIEITEPEEDDLESKQKKKEEKGGGIQSLIPESLRKDKETKEDTKTPEKDEEETENEDQNIPVQQVPVSLEDLYVIVGDAEFLAFQEYRAGQDLAEQTMAWLRTTKQFSEVGVTQVVQYADPGERSEKIEQKIQEGDRLLAEAKQLQTALGQEVAFWTQRNNQDNALAKKVNDEYKAILQNIDVTKLNPKVTELTEARRKIAESQTYLSAYSSLLKNVQNFERLLKSKVIPVYRPSAPEESAPTTE